LDSDEYVGKAEFNPIESRYANVAVSCQEERAQVHESVGVRILLFRSRELLGAAGVEIYHKIATFEILEVCSRITQQQRSDISISVLK
jgi:hypothetical protein